MCVHEELEMGKFFAMEDEFLDVGSVGDGVEGRAAFAFGGLGACGLKRVEARGKFAFVIWSHVEYRIAEGLKVTIVKCFRILVECLVTLNFERVELQTYLCPFQTSAASGSSFSSALASRHSG